MAYDGYRQSPGPYDQMANPQPEPTSPSDPHFSNSTPPYPSHYGPDRINMPHPQMPPSSSSQPPNPDPTWQQHGPQTGGVHDAVNTAYNQTDNPAYVPPEVLSHITASVVQQLKTTGLDNLQGQQPPPQPPPQFQPQPQPQQTWPPPSGPGPYASPPPPQGMAAQNPWQYQPPQQYPAPPQQPWPPVSGSVPSYPEAHPMAAQNQGAAPPNITTEYADPSYQAPGYAGSPRPSSKSSSVPQPDRRESPLSQGSDYNQSTEARQKGPSRNPTLTELSTLEKIWGKLFDHGRPTDRLGQFLRGIAVHLVSLVIWRTVGCPECLTSAQIEDYSPGNTLVIVPEKMQRFYEDTNVESDQYPWQGTHAIITMAEVILTYD